MSLENLDMRYTCRVYVGIKSIRFCSMRRNGRLFAGNVVQVESRQRHLKRKKEKKKRKTAQAHTHTHSYPSYWPPPRLHTHTQQPADHKHQTRPRRQISQPIFYFWQNKKLKVCWLVDEVVRRLPAEAGPTPTSEHRITGRKRKMKKKKKKNGGRSRRQRTFYDNKTSENKKW